MSYYNSLAFHLRIRRMPESEIAEILNEVQTLSQQSGQKPEQRFGPAQQYAAGLPKGTVSSIATRIATAILVIAMAAMAVDLTIGLVSDTHPHAGPVRLIFPLFALEIATIAAALIADHRLPHGFTTDKGVRN